MAKGAHFAQPAPSGRELGGIENDRDADRGIPPFLGTNEIPFGARGVPRTRTPSGERIPAHPIFPDKG